MLYQKLLKYYTKIKKKNHYLNKYLTKKMPSDIIRCDIKGEKVLK